MGARLFFLLLVLFGWPNRILAGGTLYILDASGSMATSTTPGCQNGKCGSNATVFDLALNRLTAQIGTDSLSRTPSGLIAFSHRGTGCSDIELIAGVSASSKSRILEFIQKVSPRGPTPLANALREAENTLKQSPSGTRIVILSDGGENCSGNPVEAARSIRAHFPASTIDIEFIGTAPDNVKQELSEVAAAGGGAFRETSPGKKPTSVPAMTFSANPRAKSAPPPRHERIAGVDYPAINPESIPTMMDFRGENRPPEEEPKTPEPRETDQKLDIPGNREPAEFTPTPLL